VEKIPLRQAIGIRDDCMSHSLARHHLITSKSIMILLLENTQSSDTANVIYKTVLIDWFTLISFTAVLHEVRYKEGLCKEGYMGLDGTAIVCYAPNNIQSFTRHIFGYAYQKIGCTAKRDL
jgi:hypothetical protein